MIHNLQGRSTAGMSGHLVAEVLGDGRDAGIAAFHALRVHQKSASKKPGSISGVGLMQIF